MTKKWRVKEQKIRIQILTPNSLYKLWNVHVFARAHFSHATQLGQPVSCCRGSGSVLLQKWLNICYAVAQCRNLLKSSKICSWLLPHLQESMDLIIVSTLLQLFVLFMEIVFSHIDISFNFFLLHTYVILHISISC